MAGEGRLHGDLRRFQVADFADHHHVRVLAQNSAQTAREAHIDLGVDLRLADPGQHVFHRVLDGQDIAGPVVDLRQARIQGRGLARTGGPGDQNNAVGAAQALAKPAVDGGRHRQLREAQLPGLLVQQTQHHALAVGRGNRGHADIDGVPGNTHGDAAVLGHAALGDIQARHDFEPRYEQRAEHALEGEHLGQQSVDAIAHTELVLKGLQVNIRGFLAHGFGENRVDQANNGGVVFRVHEIAGVGNLLGKAAEIDIGADIGGHLLRLTVVALVGPGELRLEVGARKAAQLHAGADAAAQLQQHLGRQRPVVEHAPAAVRVQHHAMRGGIGKGQPGAGRGRIALGPVRNPLAHGAVADGGYFAHADLLAHSRCTHGDGGACGSRRSLRIGRCMSLRTSSRMSSSSRICRSQSGSTGTALSSKKRRPCSRRWRC